MTDTLTQLGVGGIFSIMILKIVFDFVKNSKGSKTSSPGANGNAPVARKEFEDHRKEVQYRGNCEQIVKRIDGRFVDMRDLSRQQQEHQETRFNTIDSHLSDVKELIKTLK